MGIHAQNLRKKEAEDTVLPMVYNIDYAQLSKKVCNY